MSSRKCRRLAIIGCGGFVRGHVRTIVKEVPEFEFAGLVEPSPAKLKQFRKELPKGADPPVFDNHEKMLAEVKPDAVIVSTPHTLHFRHACDSIMAGAHVMVEKPMVTNSGDARRLVAAAEENKRILQIAIQGTYTASFAYARKLLSDGTVGPLQLVSGVLAQDWLKATKGKWRQDPELSGGGQLYDSTAHVLSAMMFLVDSPVVEAFCRTDNKSSQVDINAVGCIVFENGCMGTITSGGDCAAFYSHLVLQGENALVEISPHGGSFRITGEGLAEDITAVPKDWGIPTVAPARNFADAIAGKAEPRCGGRVGILLADLMDALYESADTGRPARVG